MKTTNSICNIWTGWQRNTFIRKEKQKKKNCFKNHKWIQWNKKKKKKKEIHVRNIISSKNITL